MKIPSLISVNLQTILSLYSFYRGVGEKRYITGDILGL